jgi:hypothetical protein
MKMISKSLWLFTWVLVCICPNTIIVKAQNINPDILQKSWNAYWIAVPNQPAKDYGVYFFRKTFDWQSTSNSFVIHVSGDNRYKLFVNGKMVSLGPARGDLSYWNFETLDIAPYLEKGKNTISSIVWNDGEYRPEGQISHRTGFVLQGNSTKESIINTNSSWKSWASKAYRPITGVGYQTYYVAGPGELLDMNLAVAGTWQKNEFDDTAWQNAMHVSWRGASPKGIGDITDWMLVPSRIPQMELSTQRFAKVGLAEGIAIPQGFPQKITPITIPARSHVTITLDQSHLTNAYPTLLFSKGKNSRLSMVYAEALFEAAPFEKGQLRKGNRNEIAGKVMAGRKDSIVSSGAIQQNFTSLAWRTFRYVQLTIDTQDEPLLLDDIYSTFTGYPFVKKATFETPQANLHKILEIGWLTARLCAVETYMDCPFYEQLQYVGDTRIQALVSYYTAGDDRLVRNALDQMDHSRMAEGITLSRHPSFSPQQIPTFSLWYIGMLHDFWRYRGDEPYIKHKMQGVRNVLWFFEQYQQADGTLKNVPYWVFTDWVQARKGWSNGVAPYGKSGESSILDFQLLWALQLASEMESLLGSKENANIYNQKAIQLQKTIKAKYWDSTKELFADTEDKDIFSQHANALAILTHTVEGSQALSIGQQLTINTALAPASIYFKYYLHQALVQAGLGNDYIKWLGDWQKNIDLGLSTWAEISEVEQARSDCHAWGASPNIEFYRVLLGIDSDAAGFSKVKIKPHLGSIEAIGGTMPHPQGNIRVSYQLKKGQWNILVELPNQVTGTFLWKNQSYPLVGGSNTFIF